MAKINWGIKQVCIILFMVVCAAVFLFLHQFTESREATVQLSWQSAVYVQPDGSEEELDPAAYMPPEEITAGYYRFTTTLPADFSDSNLIFEVSGWELSLLLDGSEIYSSALILPQETLGLGQLYLPLPTSAAGGTLTLICRQVAEVGIFPPHLRYNSEDAAEVGAIAYANLFAIPAGVYAFAFILICGIFLLGLAWRKPDWSLLPLAAAACGLLLRPLTSACGFYFLPPWLNHILLWDGVIWLIMAALAAYLWLNSCRRFWRFFGWAALASFALLLLIYTISLVCGGYFAGYINDQLVLLLQLGIYDWLLHWLTLWLVMVCALISVYNLTQSMAQAQADRQSLALREQLAMENYHRMESKLRETAALRHEIKHQLTALSALCHQGDMAALGRELAKLTETASQQPLLYSANFAVNAILQNAASQAAAAGVDFAAVALTPADIPLPEVDLCGFLLNMLDNALEASCQAAPAQARFIRFRLELSGSFLAFRCENSYQGPLKLDAKGWPQTTKAEPANHGFGLRQMREIAERYGSILDLTFTDDTFTVQSALCLAQK